MRIRRTRRAALSATALGLVLMSSLSACQATEACTDIEKVNTVIVTVDGDGSQIDRMFACSPEVTECVVPRKDGDPYASRAPGPWAVAINPSASMPTEADIYAVDANNKVLAKQRVKLTWTTETSQKCGAIHKAQATVTIT